MKKAIDKLRKWLILKLGGYTVPVVLCKDCRAALAAAQTAPCGRISSVRME